VNHHKINVSQRQFSTVLHMATLV